MTVESTAIPPTHWPTRAAWTVVKSREEFGGDLPLLSMSAQHGVRLRPEGEGRAASDDTSGYRVVAPGDLVVNRLSARDGAYGISGLHGLVSPAYWVLQTCGDVDPRWLDYVLRSAPYRAELIRISKLMPPAQFDLPWDQFRKLPIPIPPASIQGEVADYLDAETARIDALIEKKQRMKELIAERTSSLASSLIWSGSPWRSVRLRFLTGRPTSGNRDHSNFTFEAGGVTCLRGVNVRPNKLALDDAMTISTEDHRLHDETSLEEGDVVIVRSGFAGAAAAIPAGLGPCNCVDLVVVRRSASLVPDYLQYVINSARTQEVVRVRQAGAILSHFNAVDAGDIEVPVRPLEEQKSIALTTKRMLADADRISDALDQQVDLLRESRQALITAAVTGELTLDEEAA